MKKTYTLKELAEIHRLEWNRALRSPSEEEKAGELAVEAVLAAIGYELPKDEEREAFEKWCGIDVQAASDERLFRAWKDGREELRRAINKPSYSTPPSYEGIALLASQHVSKEPPWIPWSGGACPLPDTVKKCEVRCRDGHEHTLIFRPQSYLWNHSGVSADIVAYRVLES